MVEHLINLVMLPYYLLLWILKIALWIAGVILVAFLNILFGPLPCEWRKRRRWHRYW